LQQPFSKEAPMTSRAALASQRFLGFLALALSSAGIARAASVGTAFTYQGQLQNTGVPQNGPCDFRFKLFDAVTSGSQVGSTQTLSSVGVANGLFTVSIDFGSSAFSGSARWLETGVACPTGGSFTTLSPRQAMAPAPNAIFAETASVSTDGSTLTGNGTGAAPLAVANPLGLLQNSGTATITGTNFGTGPGVYGNGAGGYGLYGVSALSVAVFGDSTGSDGVHGHTTSGPAAGVAGVNESFGAGVYGQSNGGGAGLYGNSGTGDGVYGRGDGLNGVEGFSQFNTGVRGSSGNGYGVWGSSTTFDGVHGDTSSNYSGVAGVNGAIGDGVYGYAAGDSSFGDGNGVHAVGTLSCSGQFCGTGSYALWVDGVTEMTSFVGIGGDLNVVGAKNFVMPHPSDASKEIVFTALEGPESGTYFRGTTRLVGGYAEVAVPESFRLVSSEQGLTVIATPVGAPAMIVCMSRSLDKIVFQGSSDVEFDYMVNGIRAGYENSDVIQPNRTFVPRRASDRRLAALSPETVRRLKASGILNDDGTVNEETARRMGWDKRANWSAPEPQRNR
jgi:hypothetical protein